MQQLSPREFAQYPDHRRGGIDRGEWLGGFRHDRCGSPGRGQNEEPGTEACIIAVGSNYLAFVTGHPEFYDLMWGDFGLRAIDAENTDVKTTGFYVLVEAVEAWCNAQGLTDYDALELAVKLWGNAHGLACLAMNHHVEKFMPGVEVSTLLASSTRTFLDGLKQDLAN